MPLKTLSAKFHPNTFDAVERKCKLLGCSKSEYLRWCVIWTNTFVNKLVYRTQSMKTENLGVEALELELAKVMAELVSLMGEEGGDAE